MTYSEFLNLLRLHAEPKFADFQRRLIFTEREILGVRTPMLRKLAKMYAKDIKTILSYPDTYYEVVFIKLTMISALPYSEFINYVEQSVALMDNWALCDSFKANCIKKHKKEFLSVLQNMFTRGGEYQQRYPLVVLLFAYVDEEYFSTLENFIQCANTKFYYVHMAVAWLLAEILIKQNSFGIELLKKRLVDTKTHNKAIQKAIESYRLTNEQKEYLRSLKIKQINKR